MIELAHHIEMLLLESDCVIVPGFGGFVAHYSPAAFVAQEDRFLSPIRTIGFNPRLNLNDGMLAQSYMALYDTHFSDAVKRIEKDVEAWVTALHEIGKVELANIGELRYTLHDTYAFIPYDHKIVTPFLYGLDSFEMRELSAMRMERTVGLSLPVAREKSSYEISVNRTFLRSAVAAVAAILLFFFLSTPIENTAVEVGNYAELLPADLFEKIEKKSVTQTPIFLSRTQPAKGGHSSRRVLNKPLAVKEITVPKTRPETPAKAVTETATKAGAVASIKTVTETPAKATTELPAQRVAAAKGCHIIVASGVALKNAERLVAQLKEQGYADATVLQPGVKNRVSISSFASSEEATKQMLQLRKQEQFQNAWLLTN